jgi:hypothetical protein
VVYCVVRGGVVDLWEEEKEEGIFAMHPKKRRDAE